MISMIFFILVFLSVFLVPQLVQSSLITVGEAVVLAILISFLISFVLLRFGRDPAKSRPGIKIFLLAGLVIYAVMGPIIYIMTSDNTIGRLILFIPIDMVIFITPILLFVKERKKEIPLSQYEYSETYTKRLIDLVSPSEAEGHEVYISDKPLGRSFAQVSDGKNWKVFLKRESISQLDPNQIDAILLEVFFSRRKGMVLKLVTFISIYVAVLLDVLLLGFILGTLLPSAYDIYILILMAAAVVLIVVSPLVFRMHLSSLQGRIDREVLKHLVHSEYFVSTIEKKAKLMVPLRPMTQKQQLRYYRRIDRITEKRIRRISEFASSPSRK